jgi:hypothetical protein
MLTSLFFFSCHLEKIYWVSGQTANLPASFVTWKTPCPIDSFRMTRGKEKKVSNNGYIPQLTLFNIKINLLANPARRPASAILKA